MINAGQVWNSIYLQFSCPVQVRALQFQKLIISKPKWISKCGWKHIKIPDTIVSPSKSQLLGDKSNTFYIKLIQYTYGFQVEFLRRRSTVRNNIIKNLSSTSPSSYIALHSGPSRGSCKTLIGVMAKSSGTKNSTPDSFSQVNQLLHP